MPPAPAHRTKRHSKAGRARFHLQSEFDPAVNNASFCVRINLGEGWHLVRWENHLAETSLPSVSEVFEIDKKAVFAEGLFARDSQDPKRFGPKSVTQKLAARVIGFKAGLEV